MSNRPINAISFIKNIPTKPEEISKNIAAINSTLMWISPFLNRDLGQFAPPAEFLSDGLLAYSNGTDWDAGSGQGYYYYKLATTSWVKIG